MAKKKLRFYKLLRHGKNKTKGYWRKYIKRLVKEFKIILPGFLFLVLVINFFFGRGEFGNAKEKLLINSGDVSSRNYLAEKLLEKNQLWETQNILHQNIDEKLNEPERVKKEILKWQEISENFPGYRDSYLKLAILNWKIYRDFDSKKFLEKALELDPNNETARLINQVTK